MALPFQGNPSGNLIEVAANTLAMRVSERPMNVGAFGSYSGSAASLIMAAGLAGASPIFSMRSAAAAGPNILVRRVLFSAIVLGTGFTAGSCLFQTFVARAYTISDTGGTASTLTTNNIKRRTGHATTAIQDFRFATTGVTTNGITAGTRVLDATPVSSIYGMGSNTASTVILPPTEILRYGPEAWPIVLAPNEGIVIQATVAATGTWSWAVDVDWDEVPSTEL